MFAWRIGIVVGCLGVAAVAGCGGSSVPYDQKGITEEITALGGAWAVNKNDPEKGVYTVNLSGTKADDATVAKLEGLPELQHLKLNGTSVTNAAVESFKKMQKLLTLDIGNTKITEAGLEAIRTSLPQVEITWNVPDAPPPDPNEPPPPVE